MCAVTSTDDMPVDCYCLHTFFGHVASRIINEHRGMNWVTCDISCKLHGGIE